MTYPKFNDKDLSVQVSKTKTIFYHNEPKYWSDKAGEFGKRSSLQAPMIMNDNVEVRSMSDGKIYTSKAKLRQSYRDQGIVEMGNERPKPKKRAKPKGVRDSLKKAMAQTNF